MEYTFSWSWFGIGTLMIAFGVALTVWHRPIADNFGSGAMSYERFRLWGLIATVVGLIVSLNVHSLFLNWFFSLLFGQGS